MPVYPTLLVNMTLPLKRWIDMLLNGQTAGFLNIIGGCCGTTPDHIKGMADAVANIAPREIKAERNCLSFIGVRSA